MSKLTKIVSKILVFVLLVQAIPTIILTNTYNDVKDSFAVIVDDIKEDILLNEEEKTITNNDITDKTSYILNENILKRTETRKEFTLSTGEIMVQNFLSPVHFFNGENYEEIDNSLLETNEYLENKGNSFKVRFYNDKVYVQENDSYISFTYSENFTRTNYSSTISKTANYDYTNKKLTSPVELELNSSNVTYVSNDISFEYNLSSNILKEDIIIEDNLKEEYSFLIETNEELILENNTIVSNTFCIPAPNILNGNNELSYDINYELNKVNSGYELKLLISNEYIQNAVYPITIDPIITSSINVDNFIFVSETQEQTTCPNYIGDNDGLWYSYVSFDLPEYSSYHLVNMALNYYIQNGTSLSNFEYNVNVVENIGVSNITSSNRPNVVNTISNIEISGTNVQALGCYVPISCINSEELTLGFEPVSTDTFALLYYIGIGVMSLTYNIFNNIRIR